ncbi:MAG: hypothetical protein P4L36_13280 [Holophaga sp.]|nr:hypothetical protein [Holophaga sp.]
MDESNQAGLKNVLQQWVDDRQLALRERVLAALDEAPSAPDAALVDRILSMVPPAPPAAERDTDADLGAGLDLMAEAATQGEVLKRLLEAIMRFGQRSALFVIKQGIATLYAHRGFEADHPKLGVPVVPPPDLEQLIHGQTGLVAAPGPAYLALLGPLSQTPAPALRIIPLHLRRKTVALLLVDSGPQPGLTHPSYLRAVALGAEARLTALAGAREEERVAHTAAQPSVLTQRIPDPIAETGVPALDPMVRINAERSARVLVGDIELYFPAKVAQGQSQGNLYAAMRDELDRSRASFVERYGAELESQHQIFYKTVVQQLCAGNPARLGPAPWATR